MTRIAAIALLARPAQDAPGKHASGPWRFWLPEAVLADPPERSGWLGRNLDGVRVRLPDRWVWEKEVNVRQKLEIGPYDEFPGDRTQASWFPPEDYARKWQEFCLTAAVKDWSVLRAPVRAPAGAQVLAGAEQGFFSCTAKDLPLGPLRTGCCSTTGSPPIPR